MHAMEALECRRLLAAVGEASSFDLARLASMPDVGAMVVEAPPDAPLDAFDTSSRRAIERTGPFATAPDVDGGGDLFADLLIWTNGSFVETPESSIASILDDRTPVV
ncbi:MAG: hypothetical protein KDA28_15655, partial [Phycisphaerales bacterium]|nr:hypothetical protein [Phycisphaerales bacterium]